MPEHITVLTHDVGEAPTFTVNTAVENVAVANPANGWLVDPSANGFFQNGESSVLLSVGFRLPHNFVLGQTPGAAPTPISGALDLFYQARAGGPFFNYLNEASGRIFVPFENYELASDVFIDSSGVGDDWRLRSLFTTLPVVSMVNVPAALNTNIYACSVFVKILHNNNIIA